jgi:predicted ribosome quality control (RQC) complex YloA/Tae2 family protein
MNADAPPKTKQELEKERFEQLANAARRRVSASIAKGRKLVVNLQGDLEKHGDPELWKRYGDLLLANLSSATRDGDAVLVHDFFEEGEPVITIIGERNRSINEIAEDYFRRYTKARNGKRVINERIVATLADIDKKLLLLSKVDEAIASDDAEFLNSVIEPRKKVTEVRKKKKSDVEFTGARRFVSSDGYEILVGKKAKDNDFLTFRVARSLDTWMHAADFPGSHVVIRNPNRKELPQKTLIEAAQLAAFYSNARELDKAAVNYTLKKFVNKPKRSAPGLVSLASFKTLYVPTSIPAALDER